MTEKSIGGWIYFFIFFEALTMLASIYFISQGSAASSVFLALTMVRLYFVFDIQPLSVLFIKSLLLVEIVATFFITVLSTGPQVPVNQLLFDLAAPIFWYIAWHTSDRVKSTYQHQKYLPYLF